LRSEEAILSFLRDCSCLKHLTNDMFCSSSLCPTALKVLLKSAICLTDTPVHNSKIFIVIVWTYFIELSLFVYAFLDSSSC